MEEFVKNHPVQLPLPQVSGEDTIFEFWVDEKGQWQHWQTKVQLSNYQETIKMINYGIKYDAKN